MKRKKQLKKAEKDYLSKVREIGCIACHQVGKKTEAIIHHIRKHTGLGLRPSTYDTIPLCPEHHNMGNESIHLNKKVFIKKFGTEQDLLHEVKEIIKSNRQMFDFN